ncbi:hypothetical protein J4G43_052220 (plasmid) [Bradyrhizobium barranii subsp. barranii]|uniref:Uncharacterized protein n=1 Tax=Bradyrhizobium barranii subsp. barranii TaxID=2823807 RepID=A0A939MHF0_9BRAD|nr:hypothetical protein [Bradyrhizobium barranii]UEM18045.1 hypothetical protein J4G43_052220 [Bradyrhizobium barranii subsp. barranii]
MDPAVATLDFAKAGAIIANMIESYLAAGPRRSMRKEPIMLLNPPRGSVKIPRVWSLETPPPDDRRQRR